MNLIEINQKIEALRDKDLDPEVLKDTLDSLELTRNSKLDSIAGWIEQNNRDIDWIAEKIKAFSEEKKRLTNQNKSLMSYMTHVIDEAGVKELHTDNHILKPRNYRASTVIDDEGSLPDSYLHKETIEKIDKKLLYADLKAGIKVQGAHLEPNRKTRII